MWLAPHESEKLEVEILVDEEMIRITSRGALIGNWQFSDVEMRREGSIVRLFVEGEELVITPKGAPLPIALLAAGAPNGATGRHASGNHTTNAQTRIRHGRGAHRADRSMLWKW